MLGTMRRASITWSALCVLFPILCGASKSVSSLVDSLGGPSPQTSNGRICPLPECLHCPTIEEINAPGIGFALETSHGTAVIRHQDGSYERITIIQGSVPYTALLRRLATGPKSRTPTHFDTNWEKVQYVKKRAQRLTNKLLGRPATPDTAILAAMVSALQGAVEARLGGSQRVTQAVLSSPDRIKFTPEEVNDIFDYLRIVNLMAIPDNLEDLYATSAAYAGFGMGLCRDYTNPYACEQDEVNLPLRRVLHIDINHESLSGTIKTVQIAKESSHDKSYVDPDLGYARIGLCLANEPRLDSSHGWDRVADSIRLFVHGSPRITHLLLTGSYATDEGFKAAVRDALDGIAVSTPFDILNLNTSGLLDYRQQQQDWKDAFVFATAQGAAEFAKRRQEGPVRCAESEACRQRLGREDMPKLLKQEV